MDESNAGALHVLLIASDPLARTGLAGLLDEWPGLALVDAAPDEAARIEARDGYAVDIVLWDLGAGADPSLTLDFQPIDPPVVALLPDDALIEQVWAAGARGMLLRNADPETIVHALTAVEGGLVVIDPDLAEALPALREPAPSLDELTPREEEVLELLAEGLPNKLIADRLQISENTVKFHVSAILSKLGAHSRTEAVMRAARKGLLII